MPEDSLQSLSSPNLCTEFNILGIYNFYCLLTLLLPHAILNTAKTCNKRNKNQKPYMVNKGICKLPWFFWIPNLVHNFKNIATQRPLQPTLKFVHENRWHATKTSRAKYMTASPGIKLSLRNFRATSRYKCCIGMALIIGIIHNTRQ